MKRKSTTTNLLKITAFISERLQKRGQCDVIHVDFSTAFDRVDHWILAEKLCAMGMAQFVLMCSDLVESTIGTDVRMSIYADDTKVYRSISDENDCKELQQVIDRIAQWTTLNRLQLNVEKTKFMTFTKIMVYSSGYALGKRKIERSSEHRDLGSGNHLRSITKLHQACRGCLHKDPCCLTSHLQSIEVNWRSQDGYSNDKNLYLSGHRIWSTGLPTSELPLE